MPEIHQKLISESLLLTYYLYCKYAHCVHSFRWYTEYSSSAGIGIYILRSMKAQVATPCDHQERTQGSSCTHTGTGPANVSQGGSIG